MEKRNINNKGLRENLLRLKGNWKHDSPSAVAHIYNPSYLEAQIGKVADTGQPEDKFSEIPILINNPGRMALTCDSITWETEAGVL
jgi:hypothetical protein